MIKAFLMNHFQGWLTVLSAPVSPLRAISCYADAVLRNTSVGGSGAWAGAKTADGNIPVSTLPLEQTHADDEYWRAYRRWIRFRGAGAGSAQRLTRDEAHARR